MVTFLVLMALDGLVHGVRVSSWFSWGGTSPGVRLSVVVTSCTSVFETVVVVTVLPNVLPS